VSAVLTKSGVRLARAWRGTLKQRTIGKILGVQAPAICKAQLRYTWRDVR
jgi:hypothetical protein